MEPAAAAAASPPPSSSAPRPPSSTLSTLWLAAKEVFSPGRGEGNAPTAAELGALRELMRRVPLSELGLVDPSPFASAAAPADSSSASASSSASSSSEELGRLSLGGGDDGGAGGGGGETPPPAISYLDVAEDSAAALGVFVLPPRAAIPLHNHPGMTVSSRVLFGRLHVRSFDWASGSEESDDAEGAGEKARGGGGGGEGGESERRRRLRRRAGLRRARLVEDRVIDASALPTQLTSRGGGNIHAFANASGSGSGSGWGSGGGAAGDGGGGEIPCAVLDLLAPPYCAEDDRDCTYFVEEEPEEEEEEGEEEAAAEEKGAEGGSGGAGGAAAAARSKRRSPPRARAGRRATRPGEIALLRAVPAPADFVVEHAPYRGIRPAAAAAGAAGAGAATAAAVVDAAEN